METGVGFETAEQILEEANFQYNYATRATPKVKSRRFHDIPLPSGLLLPYPFPYSHKTVNIFKVRGSWLPFKVLLVFLSPLTVHSPNARP